MIKVLIVFLLMVTQGEAVPTIKNVNGTNLTKCFQEINDHVKMVNCSGKKLRKFPNNIEADTQVLIFQGNKLSRINNFVLKKFSKMTRIDFSQNSILHIDANAFMHQEKYLKYVDLSGNHLSSIPAKLFQYPELTTLLIKKNHMGHFSFKNHSRSNLEYLDVSGNELSAFPSSMLFPKLKYLNISNNNIGKVTINDLTVFCSLEILDIENNPLSLTGCECEDLNEWITTHKIQFKSHSIKNCSVCIRASTNINPSYEMYNRTCIKPVVKIQETISTTVKSVVEELDNPIRYKLFVHIWFQIVIIICIVIIIGAIILILWVKLKTKKYNINPIDKSYKPAIGLGITWKDKVVKEEVNEPSTELKITWENEIRETETSTDMAEPVYIDMSFKKQEVDVVAEIEAEKEGEQKEHVSPESEYIEMERKDLFMIEEEKNSDIASSESEHVYAVVDCRRKRTETIIE